MPLRLASRLVRPSVVVVATLAGALLFFHWAYPRYWYPLLGAVDESTLGSVLATRVDELVDRGVVRVPSADTPSLGICFEASGRFETGKPFFAAEPFSAFRAIGGRFSPPAWLLDRYLTRAVLAQQLSSEVPFGLDYDPEAVFAVCQQKLRKLLEVHPRFVDAKERRRYEGVLDGLRFLGSCGGMNPSDFRFPVLQVVAVSPLVVSGFSLNRAVASASGFFLAEELVLPGVKAERRVFYYIAKPLIIRCRKDLGRGEWLWGVEVPEDYWGSAWPFRQFAALLEKSRCCWLHVDTGYRFLGASKRVF